jgi:hypothetical protein
MLGVCYKYLINRILDINLAKLIVQTNSALELSDK